MNFIAIVSATISILKSLPKAVKIIEKFYSLWVRHEITKIDNQYASTDAKIDALINSISRAKTKEERHALSIILNDVSNNKL